MKPVEPWWPDHLGNPDSTGGQNELRYAYFGSADRLVVDDNGRLTTYDTGGRTIHGFGQQQSVDPSITIATDKGPMRLVELSRVD